MKLRLGFSPCPNDTFIFDALLHQKIDTEGLEFDLHLADVEELNQLAFRQKLDITKLSYHAYAHLVDPYVLLDAGSALGRNCGPLLIAREPIPEEQIPNSRVAIPGKYTTANFLLRLAYPSISEKEEMLFSGIEQAVLDQTVDAGLIIHENRFTYQDKGLVKLMDLGEYWEQTTGYPIPLGGIAIRRKIPRSVQWQVNRVLQRSVAHALDHPDDSYEFVRTYAQEMDREVMYKHIRLYVNDFTYDLGIEGKAAVRHLFRTAKDKRLIPASSQSLFLQKESAAN